MKSETIAAVVVSLLIGYQVGAKINTKSDLAMLEHIDAKFEVAGWESDKELSEEYWKRYRTIRDGLEYDVFMETQKPQGRFY